MKSKWQWAGLILLCLLVSKSYSQSSISVNVNTVLNDVSHHPIGINVNYLMDDGFIQPAPPISTTQALAGMKIKFLRYPGGEKSDNYLWSVLPWNKANPKFARTGKCEWPSGDANFAHNDWTTPKSLVLDFDEFMSMVNSTGAEPLIVVPYDAMYKALPSGCNGTIPTRAQLITHAVEWVRYANKVKGHNIKYWMIGNESYFNCNYNGCATATQYRDDIIDFSIQMKAVDPTIKIIANGDGNSWWSTVLPKAAPHIDFIGVSNYPAYNFTGGYTFYKNNTPNFMGVVNNTVNAINSYAPSADKHRIKVITTEFNSNDWSGKWPDLNDLGHALAAFEILGEHLKHPKVEAAIFWNTRWINNTKNPSDIYDALSKTNQLQPNGRAIAIWGNFLLDKMVASTSTTSIRTFASYRQSGNKLNVFLINKETINQQVNLSVSNYLSNVSAAKWELKGNGPADTAPSWTSQGNATLSGNSLALNLPPVSLTVLSFNASGALPVELVDFSAKPEDDVVKLFWRTASETNNDFFSIERALPFQGDAEINLNELQFVNVIDYVKSKALGGNSSSELHYHAADSVAEIASKTLYYRLKQTDFDGSYSYSNVVSVNIENSTLYPVEIFPNPADEKITVRLKKNISPLSISIASALGKEIFFKSYGQTNSHSIEINTLNWAPGIYFLRIISAERIFSEKFIIK